MAGKEWRGNFKCFNYFYGHTKYIDGWLWIVLMHAFYHSQSHIDIPYNFLNFINYLEKIEL
jgi:hypothetical protein